MQEGLLNVFWRLDFNAFCCICYYKLAKQEMVYSLVRDSVQKSFFLINKLENLKH